MVLWKKKDRPADAVQDAPAERPGAKNRPTPRRRDQEAANRRPLVVTDRKAASKADREKMRQARLETRQALLSGDESKMPVRDRGPVRRYVRDFVDARFSLGEILLPIMLLSLLISFIREPWAFTLVAAIVYGLFAGSIMDAFFMWRVLKRRLIAKFGADQIPRGLLMYAAMRAFQLRPTRLPRPVVKRGQWPS